MSSSPEQQQLTFAVLARQDDVTSGLVLKLLDDSKEFKTLAAKEGNDLIQRDKEDEDKLAKGIEISVKKGVLKAHPEVSEVQKINVLGKSADQVADEILAKLPVSEASVLVLQGLSGTGKGTTVSKLKSRLSQCITWSNGNVFRTATYLINESLKEGQEFSSEVITPDLLKGIFGRLSFKKFPDGTFDVVIDETVRVSDIANTKLKEGPVSTRVPTVAEQTQGEVVLFAAQAIEILRAAGHNVILEGRSQTLNHIPTPYRFELVIPDVTILGGRRAAQRVMAAALEAVKDKKENATSEEIVNACIEAAKTLK